MLIDYMRVSTDNDRQCSICSAMPCSEPGSISGICSRIVPGAAGATGRVSPQHWPI